MMGFTGNDRGVRIALVVLLILFVLGAAGYCSRSEAAEGLSVGFGVATAGGERCFDSLLITQELGERKWLAYLTSHGDSGSCRGERVQANIGAGLIRTTHLGRWSIGFGVGVLEHGDIAIGPESIISQDPPRIADRAQLTAAILIRRRVGERFVVDWVHNSTGGSTRFNRGLNTVALGVQF